jgi:transcriptional regulator with XRE-family HTH domain
MYNIIHGGDNLELHDRIKEIRKENKLSQSAFGEKLGVSRDVINNIENNRLARPEQKTSLVKLISKEFSISEDWLLTGKGEKVSPNVDDERLAKILVELHTSGNEKLKNTIEKMLELDDKYIDIILNLVDTVLEDQKK